MRQIFGFIVSERGIEIYPSECRAILDMAPPRTPKEVQVLTGRIAALNRFIARSILSLTNFSSKEFSNCSISDTTLLNNLNCDSLLA